MHSPVGLHVTEWTNPQPRKAIKSIDLIGNLSPAQLVLVGITGGVETDGIASPGRASVGRVVSEWNLGSTQGQSVTNAVNGAGALTLSQNAPVAAEVAGVRGLRFKGGQSLTGETKQIPNFDLSNPWALEATIAVDAKPDGFVGGIYQAMNYSKSGMRLVLDQQMRLGVEIWTGEGQNKGIRGQSVLTPGRVYNTLVRFDGSRAYLYVNGKLDGSVDTPLPAPYSGPIQIGVASGKDYNFNGFISGIRVLALD
jgi:hypothetical protein